MLKEGIKLEHICFIQIRIIIFRVVLGVDRSDLPSSRVERAGDWGWTGAATGLVLAFADCPG